MTSFGAYDGLVENFHRFNTRRGRAAEALVKLAFHKWNNPKPAPEYQFGWNDKKAARASLQRILR
jgi:hypothetical protein